MMRYIGLCILIFTFGFCLLSTAQNLTSTGPDVITGAIGQYSHSHFWLNTCNGLFQYEGDSVSNVTNKAPQAHLLSLFDGMCENRADPFSSLPIAATLIVEDKAKKDAINFALNLIGYLYLDKNGNSWTSTATGHGWALPRYDKKSWSEILPTLHGQASRYEANKGLIFAILEAPDGSIWLSSPDGMYRYDGKTAINYKAE